MLQWVADGSGGRFMGIVHHTDAEREYMPTTGNRISAISTRRLMKRSPEDGLLSI
jgi:hypothetical protein